MSIKHIRWGIIGAGDVAEVKSGPAFAKARSSKLIAVMRRDAQKAESFARRHNVGNWYDNVDELLSNKDIDAVYIATPPSSHKDIAIAAMQAGKHVYIEKPVALNADQCDDIIDAQQRTGMRASVAHYRRYVPSFKKLHELITQGAIGQPLLARVDMLLSEQTNLVAKTEQDWRIDPAISGGGLFHDLAPHQLDMLLYFFKDIDQASGFSVNQAKKTPVDDCVLGWVKFACGVEFQGRWHFNVPKLHTRDIFEIIGTKGSVSINFFGEHAIHLKNNLTSQTYRISNPLHIQQPMIEQVNAYLRGERDNPCSLSDAKKSMEIIDTFTQAVR